MTQNEVVAWLLNTYDSYEKPDYKIIIDVKKKIAYNYNDHDVEYDWTMDDNDNPIATPRIEYKRFCICDTLDRCIPPSEISAWIDMYLKNLPPRPKQRHWRKKLAYIPIYRYDPIPWVGDNKTRRKRRRGAFNKRVYMELQDWPCFNHEPYFKERLYACEYYHDKKNWKDNIKIKHQWEKHRPRHYAETADLKEREKDEKFRMSPKGSTGFYRPFKELWPNF
jgi:hypothetical protein